MYIAPYISVCGYQSLFLLSFLVGKRGQALREAMVEDLRGELTPMTSEGKTLTDMMGSRRSRL